jgi:hypothetical protein
MQRTRKRQKGGLDWQFWKSNATKNKERCVRKKQLLERQGFGNLLRCDDVDVKHFTFPSDPRLNPTVTSKDNLQDRLQKTRLTKMNERDRAFVNATQYFSPELNDEILRRNVTHFTGNPERTSATVWKNLSKEFNGFSLLQPVSVTALSTGGNGVTHLVKFENAEHVAFAVLKYSENPLLKKALAVDPDDVDLNDFIPDNILYEYVAGKTLYNALSEQFCLFVKTWGVYRNLSVKVGLLRATQNNLLPRGTTDQFVDAACREGKTFQILTEYVPTTPDLTLMNFVNDRPLVYQLLYQIYGPLGYLNTRYGLSHNDLNVKNVVLHKLPAPVRFVYVFMDGSPNVEFTCPYLVKVIDYARTTVNSGISRDFLKKLDTTRSCQYDKNPANGGKLAGFQWFKDTNENDANMVKSLFDSDAFPHETVQKCASYLRSQLKSSFQVQDKKPTYPCVTTVYGDQPYVYTETEPYIEKSNVQEPSVEEDYTYIPYLGGKKT